MVISLLDVLFFFLTVTDEVMMKIAIEANTGKKRRLNKNQWTTKTTLTERRLIRMKMQRHDEQFWSFLVIWLLKPFSFVHWLEWKWAGWSGLSKPWFADFWQRWWISFWRGEEPPCSTRKISIFLKTPMWQHCLFVVVFWLWHRRWGLICLGAFQGVLPPWEGPLNWS